MIEYVLGILQFSVLPLGALYLLLRRLWGGVSAKEYFFASKLFVLLSMAASVWNRGDVFQFYFNGNMLATVVYILTSIVFLLWMLLSLKWFTTEKLSAFRFCSLSLLILFCFNLLLQLSLIHI